jgi:hypothetical protein
MKACRETGGPFLKSLNPKGKTMVKLNTKKLAQDRENRKHSWRVNFDRFMHGQAVSEEMNDKYWFWFLVSWYLKYSKLTLIILTLIAIYIIYNFYF